MIQDFTFFANITASYVNRKKKAEKQINPKQNKNRGPNGAQDHFEPILSFTL